MSHGAGARRVDGSRPWPRLCGRNLDALAYSPAETLRAARLSRCRAGPDFAGSQDVVSADADLIVGGPLIGVKSKSAVFSAQPDLFRLLGYAPLSYSDKYQIGALGFYLSRFGRLITWPVDRSPSRCLAVRSRCPIFEESARMYSLCGV